VSPPSSPETLSLASRDRSIQVEWVWKKLEMGIDHVDSVQEDGESWCQLTFFMLTRAQPTVEHCHIRNFLHSKAFCRCISGTNNGLVLTILFCNMQFIQSGNIWFGYTVNV